MIQLKTPIIASVKREKLRCEVAVGCINDGNFPADEFTDDSIDGGATRLDPDQFRNGWIPPEVLFGGISRRTRSPAVRKATSPSGASRLPDLTSSNVRRNGSILVPFPARYCVKLSTEYDGRWRDHCSVTPPGTKTTLIHLS
jgi:hypothetical protein